MRARQALQELAIKLQNYYEPDEAKNIAELVIEFVTGMSRSSFAMEPHKELSDEQELQLKACTDRLIKNEPVQYVLNEAWFYGMKFYVDPHVLIPRPETEELVSWVLETAKDAAQKRKDQLRERNFKVIDVGTGSGCIAVAIRKNLSFEFESWACDINDLVLTVARKNADNNQALVDFVPLDFLDASQRKQLPHIDFIVSNPPYIPVREKHTMNPNVVEYEPYTALFVPDNDPMVFYKAIADFADEKLYFGGFVFVEIHENLSEPVVALFKSRGYDTELKKDMQGKNRMVRAIKKAQ